MQVTGLTRAALIILFSAVLRAQDPIQIHGYIQGRFTNQEGTPDRLEIRRARIILSGDPLAKLSYAFQVDMVKQPYLMDLSLTWKASRAVRVTGGQFKIPFSTESLTSDNLNVPVARARAVNSLSPGRDTGVQARDFGLQIAGTFLSGKRPLMDYAVAVLRGQTLVSAPHLHYPAVAGRLVVHPIAQLTVGGDWYASVSSPPRAEKRRSELEGGYDFRTVHLRTEQIWARDGLLNRRGGYALASWRASTHWEPLTRADWLTTNTHKPQATSIAYLGGLNYYWSSHVKIGFNAGAQHDQGPRGFSSLVLAQTMLSY